MISGGPQATRSISATTDVRREGTVPMTQALHFEQPLRHGRGHFFSTLPSLPGSMLRGKVRKQGRSISWQRSLPALDASPQSPRTHCFRPESLSFEHIWVQMAQPHLDVVTTHLYLYMLITKPTEAPGYSQETVLPSLPHPHLLTN